MQIRDSMRVSTASDASVAPPARVPDESLRLYRLHVFYLLSSVSAVILGLVLVIAFTAIYVVPQMSHSVTSLTHCNIDDIRVTYRTLATGTGNGSSDAASKSSFSPIHTTRQFYLIPSPRALSRKESHSASHSGINFRTGVPVALLDSEHSASEHLKSFILNYSTSQTTSAQVDTSTISSFLGAATTSSRRGSSTVFAGRSAEGLCIEVRVVYSLPNGSRQRGLLFRPVDHTPIAGHSANLEYVHSKVTMQLMSYKLTASFK